MKRTLAALLGLTLTLTLTACGDDAPAEVPQEETEQVTQPAEDPALTNLRQDLEAKGSTCAVGYLGTLPESGSAKALLEDSGCLERVRGGNVRLLDIPRMRELSCQERTLIPWRDGEA